MTMRTSAVVASVAVLAMTGMATAQSSNTVFDAPTYNGEPRSYYSYTGDEPIAFDRWQEGRISTDDFQDDTDQGEGTAALELITYNGFPREYYVYTGDEPSVFDRWQEGRISTDDFQDDTDQGEGTAALQLNTESIYINPEQFERFTDRLSERPGDSMERLSIRNGRIAMDTGEGAFGGFCGRAGYRIDLSFVQRDINAVRFEAEAFREDYAGTPGLLVNGEFADTFAVDDQPNQKTWELDTYTVETPSTDVETIGFGVQDTSSQYCNKRDHRLTLDVYDVNVIATLPEFAIDNAVLPSDTAAPGEEIQVGYEVPNSAPGDVSLEGEVTVSVGENQVSDTVSEGATTSAGVEVPEEPGEYRVIVTAQADGQETAYSDFIGNITVQESDSESAVEEFDTDDNGEISVQELIEAMFAYRSGELGLTGIQAVIDNYDSNSNQGSGSGSVSEEYDADNNNQISIQELNQGIVDFQNGEMTQEELNQLVDSYFQDTIADDNNEQYAVEDTSAELLSDVDTVAPGEEIQVGYDVSASGPDGSSIPGSVTISIGESQENRDIAISAGGSRTSSVAVEAPEEPGDYQVQVTAQANGQETADSVTAGTITVQETGQNPPEPPAEPPASSTVSFDIPSGWSIVSAPESVSSLKSTIEEECSVGTDGRTVWRARADAGGYVDPGPIRSTGGYWLNLESSCSFDTAADTSRDASYTEFEEPGFYMVSVPEATTLNSVAGSCSFSQFDAYDGPVLDLEGEEYQGLSLDTELSPKKGYWVEVQEPCQMGASAESSGPPPGPP